MSFESTIRSISNSYSSSIGNVFSYSYEDFTYQPRKLFDYESNSEFQILIDQQTAARNAKKESIARINGLTAELVTFLSSCSRLKPLIEYLFSETTRELANLKQQCEILTHSTRRIKGIIEGSEQLPRGNVIVKHTMDDFGNLTVELANGFAERYFKDMQRVQGLQLNNLYP